MSQGEKVNLYLQPGSRSEALWNEAKVYLPGGNSRTAALYWPRPVYARSGKGCYITDVEGQMRIDFLNNYTSLIHGHANPAVIEAVSRQLQLGTAFPMPTEAELKLSKTLVERLPAVDQIRFANTGSEGVLWCIKAARAYTGKDKIGRFEGYFHGNYDYVEISLTPSPEVWGNRARPNSVQRPGLSSRVAEDVVVLPSGDLDAVATLIREHKDQLAAVIMDPMPHRAGLTVPNPGFLRVLREVTREANVLLISDEVVTFRMDYHGAQGLLGYDPDLTALGKIIGGGFPVGAVGGRADVMSVFDASGGKPLVNMSGTFSANPITMVAGQATLDQFTADEVRRINHLGDELRRRTRKLFADLGFPGQVTGEASLFRLHVVDRELRNYRDQVLDEDEGERARNLHLNLLAAGVLIAPNGYGCLSTPMTETEIDDFLEALEWAVRHLEIA